MDQIVCFHAFLNNSNLQKNVLKQYFTDNKNCLNKVFFNERCCNNNEIGYTPLHIAVLTQDKKNIKLIIKTVKQTGMLKQFINCISIGNTKTTALHIAVSKDKKDTVKLLLKNGADRTIKDEEGRIPADLAVSDEMIRVLSIH